MLTSIRFSTRVVFAVAFALEGCVVTWSCHETSSTEPTQKDRCRAHVFNLTLRNSIGVLGLGCGAARRQDSQTCKVFGWVGVLHLLESSCFSRQQKRYKSILDMLRRSLVPNHSDKFLLVDEDGPVLKFEEQQSKLARVRGLCSLTSRLGFWDQFLS